MFGMASSLLNAPSRKGPASTGAVTDGRKEIVILPLLQALAPFGRGHATRAEVEDAGGVAAGDVGGCAA